MGKELSLFKIKNSFLRKRKGQAIVEAALVLPIILLILTGIIDFGLLFNNYVIITNASREGARLAAVGYSDPEVKAVINGLLNSLDQTKVTTDISPSRFHREKGDEVTVTVGYDYNFFTPIISSIVPNPLHIEGMTVMRVE
jgi:hypothetical protein